MQINVDPRVGVGDAEAALAAGVHGCTFTGKCVIEIGSPSDTIAASPRGWRNSVCIDSTCSLGASIVDSTLERCCVRSNVIVHACPLVSSSGSSHVLSRLLSASSNVVAAPAATPVWHSMALVGNSTGGRPVPLSDVLTFDSFVRLSGAGDDAIASDRESIIARARARAIYLDNAEQLHRTSLGEGTALIGCPEITALVSRGAVTIIGSSVFNSLIHASTALPTIVRGGATVRNSVLHAGVAVDGAATVSDSVLFPASGAHASATVSHCIIATGTSIGRGEASHSLIGPFVGFHHTSLLIAALWPRGRGNVAAGALLGSNHTGKLPDQEIRPGEGVFFGLGVAAKLPGVFDGAQYSLVAAGASLLPQRIDYPFSLVAPPARRPSGVQTGFNELLPGWMLYDNAYALARNEHKFAQRAQVIAAAVSGSGSGSSSSRDGGGGSTDADALGAGVHSARAVADAPSAVVCRPDIVDAMRRAVLMLTRIKSGSAAPIPPSAPAAAGAAATVYTEATLDGVGKNFVTEGARVKGVRAYSRAIRYYALSAVFAAATGRVGAGVVVGKPLSPHAVEVATELGILAVEESSRAASVPLTRLLGAAAVGSLLGEFSDMTAEDAEAARASKARDDDRGRRIQGDGDYAASHVPAEGDAVIRLMRQRAAEVNAAVERWKSAARS